METRLRKRELLWVLHLTSKPGLLRECLYRNRNGPVSPNTIIRGHNDPESIPVEGLIEATARVLRRRGQTIATYNQDCGPLSDIEMREFLAEKLAKYRGMSATTEDILVTSGSGQALDLMNDILLESGDTVIMEEFTY